MIVEPPSTTRARLDVAPERAGDALGVDAAVVVEAPVLDRDGRLRGATGEICSSGTTCRFRSAGITPSSELSAA